jgi:hypothetical protein
MVEGIGDAIQCWWENLRKKLGRPRVDGRIILRWIFRKWDGGHGLDIAGLG